MHTTLLHLSALWAAWEITKAFVGWTQLKLLTKEMSCVFSLFAIPYLAWGIWLVFAMPMYGIVLWTVGFLTWPFEIKKSPYLEIVYRADCIVSAAILSVMFVKTY